MEYSSCPFIYFQQTIKMSIEELCRQLTSSYLFKDILREQVKDCMNEFKFKESQSDLTLNCLVREIGSHLASITEMALEEQNGHNYLAFMKRNEEMYSQLQKKMERSFRVKVQELERKIEEYKDQITQLQASIKQDHRAHPTQRLKSERRAITKVILDSTRLFASNKAKSTIHPSKMQKSTNSSEIEPNYYLQTDKSRCFHQFEDTLPLSSEKENSVSFTKDFKLEIDNLKKEQAKLANECRLIGKLQSKMEMNLQGVWNVISDLTNRISRLEPLESVLEIRAE